MLQEFEYALPEKPAVVDVDEEESDSSIDFNMF